LWWAEEAPLNDVHVLTLEPVNVYMDGRGTWQK
jgi:hypothetical protein